MSMSEVSERQKKLIADFAQFKSWEERYKYVIDLGKSVPDLPATYRDDKFLVKGCQSRVWLHAQKNSAGKIELFADSDAMIVKGLVAILLKVYSLAEPADILANPPTFISELGFQSHLSPSRANGLLAMVKQIMLYAAAIQAMGK
jgi:cysteine desulfuration protein SufE